MRVKLIHKLGALILTAAVFSGIAMLRTSTAQAKGVTVVPRVYIGASHHRHHHHWRHHRNYRHW